MVARALLAMAMVGTAAASVGQGCYDVAASACSNAAATCSPHSCTASGGTWIPASSARACSADTSCADDAMAPGVALGLDIAAAAGAFSAATGDDFAAKMAARKAAYENKVVTGPDGGTFSLKDLAEPMGAEACGSAGCGAALDAYIVGLLAGTTVAGETAGWSGYEDARDEGIKKAIFNQLMSYGAITMMKDAVGGESAEDNWNAAWAVYGYLGAPNAGSQPYATANKRCKNYGTCHATMMAGSSGEAQTNVNVEAAFAAGPTAENMLKIVAEIQVTYIQAALRYANKIDKSVTACPPLMALEHMGEGHSFAQIVVATSDAATGDWYGSPATVAAAISATYDGSPCSGAKDADGVCEGVGGRYCALLNFFDTAFPEEAFAAAVGTMVASEKPRPCPDPTAAYQSCAAKETAAAAAAAAAAEPKASGASAAASGLLAAAVAVAFGN